MSLSRYLTLKNIVKYLKSTLDVTHPATICTSPNSTSVTADSAGMSAFTSIYSELRKNYIGEMARYDNLKSLKLVRIESSYAIIY